MRQLLGILLLVSLPARVSAQHAPLGEAIVELARQQIGKQYVYGASSENGIAFDCSGLAQYVYRRYSISIPRTAKEQSLSGRLVSADHLAAGDLLIFQKPTGGGLHVGIYSGQGRYISASSVAGEVVEQPLRLALLIQARRILP